MPTQWKLRGYVIEALLGSGASGDVWRARVAASGDRVALKRMRGSSPEQVQRAREEASLLASLDHPNLVRLHAVVASGDSIVLVLDLAEEGSLAQVLGARGRLTPGEVITAVSPIAATLSYLHSQSVIHGDVSAANILFDATGAPLLCDVGVARLLGDRREVRATPAYVDPAVAAGAVPGPPSDVFSLGAVAFHALTGSPVWAGSSPAELLASAACGVPDDLAARLGDARVPEPMAQAVLKALAPDPHRRGTAVGLALDLRQSATPLAIEFGAGRGRPDPEPCDEEAGAVHQLLEDEQRAGATAAPDSARSDSARADSARPDFARPGPRAAGPGSEPPTRMVVARPRPVIPRPGRRRHARLSGGRWGTASRRRRRAVTWGCIGVAAGCLAGAAYAIGAFPSEAGPRARPAVRAAPGPAAVQTRPQTAPSHSPSLSRSHSPTPPRDWAQVLGALDAVRAEAYATRDPALLAHVYLPGTLLEQDRVQLLRLVPDGCGLTGALTTFQVLTSRPGDHGSVLTVSVALAPTRLVCAGTAGAHVSAAARARLRVAVTDTPDGPRISSQQRLR